MLLLSAFSFAVVVGDISVEQPPLPVVEALERRRAPTDTDRCWLDSYGRGSGDMGGAFFGTGYSCPKSHPVKFLSMCYPRCKSGYHEQGVGNLVWCVENCKHGEYAKGPWKCGNLRGMARTASRGCPWYDSCGVWSRCNGCPGGFHKTACHCTENHWERWRHSYHRGWGVPPCKNGMEHSGWICYDPCRSGYKGVGPVCWGHCGQSTPHQAGALCCDDKMTCDAVIAGISSGVAIAAGITIATFVSMAGRRLEDVRLEDVVQELQLQNSTWDQAEVWDHLEEAHMSGALTVDLSPNPCKENTIALVTRYGDLLLDPDFKFDDDFRMPDGLRLREGQRRRTNAQDGLKGVKEAVNAVTKLWMPKCPDLWKYQKQARQNKHDCSFEKGKDYMGSDLSGPIRVDSAEACCKACKLSGADCKAWTYGSGREAKYANNCWFKKDTNFRKTANNQLTSGVVNYI